ncbi:MAG: UDP-3-O-acyl-N-acetylglucosamine deacetylase [Deltaproteobacteria bacterium]|nr:UDP-3-O-acyl-N-acetylglucosamine deacetylase [Deltaproteobacteria bacterium]
MSVNEVNISGIGIHKGKPSSLRVVEKVNKGITFYSPAGKIELSPEVVVTDINSIHLATVLKAGSAEISTVEHLLGALVQFAGGADIYVSSDEIPILDGSALQFYNAFIKAGFLPGINPIALKKETSISFNDSKAIIKPVKNLNDAVYNIILDYSNPFLGELTYSYRPFTDSFLTSIAPARTFALEKDVKTIINMGLGKGGSLENTVIISENGPLNPDKMRFNNEPARHKMLDLIGDLATLNGLPKASITITKPGHKINAMIAKEIFKMQTD